MIKKKIGSKAELLLGRNIEQLRRAQAMSRMQLGRKINKTEQQVAKYESGEFVPLSVLENIASILDNPLPKKIIRRISFLRKLEMETKIEQEKLYTLYDELISEES